MQRETYDADWLTKAMMHGRPAEASDSPPATVWIVEAGAHYLHGKTHAVYATLGTARLESDGTQLVLYQSIATGELWARPAGEFFDGRFTRL